MSTNKFRAWDISKQVYIPTQYWAVLPTDYGTGAIAIMLDNWENYKEGEYFYPQWQVIEQFTGLKDRAGVEIWEGDLRRIDGRVFKVVGDGWRFRFERNLVEFGDSREILLDEDTGYDSTLIGNIHLNPELIQ